MHCIIHTYYMMDCYIAIDKGKCLKSTIHVGLLSEKPALRCTYFIPRKVTYWSKQCIAMKIRMLLYLGDADTMGHKGPTWVFKRYSVHIHCCRSDTGVPICTKWPSWTTVVWLPSCSLLNVGVSIFAKAKKLTCGKQAFGKVCFYQLLSQGKEEPVPHLSWLWEVMF